MARLLGQSRRSASWLAWVAGAVLVAALSAGAVWVLSVAGRFIG